MSLTREQVLAYIEDLTVEELRQLTDELEQRLGPLATAPQYSNTMGAPIVSRPWPEITVVLRSAGSQRVAVIKAVRELLSLGLSDARRLVDSAPVVLREYVSPTEAEAMAERLRSAGGEVELREER